MPWGGCPSLPSSHGANTLSQLPSRRLRVQEGGEGAGGVSRTVAAQLGSGGAGQGLKPRTSGKEIPKAPWPGAPGDTGLSAADLSLPRAFKDAGAQSSVASLPGLRDGQSEGRKESSAPQEGQDGRWGGRGWNLRAGEPRTPRLHGVLVASLGRRL